MKTNFSKQELDGGIGQQPMNMRVEDHYDVLRPGAALHWTIGGSAPLLFPQ